MYMYYVVLGYSDLGEGLRQVGEQVVDMFRADGETYRGLRDALLGQFRFIELGVGGTGGWMTSDLTSATLAKRENISRLSMKRNASSRPPLISKVKMEPAPFGKYVSYSLWSGCPGNAGWLTFFTLGCVERKSRIFRVFSTWRSTRRDKVSNP